MVTLFWTKIVQKSKYAYLCLEVEDVTRVNLMKSAVVLQVGRHDFVPRVGDQERVSAGCSTLVVLGLKVSSPKPYCISAHKFDQQWNFAAKIIDYTDKCECVPKSHS
jgi:hypothetical protein